MPKIFVLRNRLLEQQARLLETQKGLASDASSANKHDDAPLIAEQEQPVALIVDRKSDTAKDNVDATGNSNAFLSINPASGAAASALCRAARICPLLCRRANFFEFA